MKYIIAIDGGGSKTLGHVYSSDDLLELNQSHSRQTSLIGPSSTPLFSQCSGASSLSAHFSKSVSTLIELIESLINQVNKSLKHSAPLEFVVSLGLAGAGSHELTDKALRALQLEAVEKKLAVTDILLMEDSVSSLLGATLHAPRTQTGVEPIRLVTLGTGSFVADFNHTKTPTDAAIQFRGGWGFPIGDEGGGARLGQMAVRAYLKYLEQQSVDLIGTQKHSDFINAIRATVGGNRTEVLSWLSRAQQADYAQLAPLVVSAIDSASSCSTSSCSTSSCSIAENIWQQHIEQVKALLFDTQSPSIYVTGGLAQPTLKYLNDTRLIYLSEPSILGAVLAAYLFCIETNSSELNSQIKNAFQGYISQLSVANGAKDMSTADIGTATLLTNSNETESKLTPLEQLVSESRNPKSMQLDMMTSSEIVALMNEEDAQIAVQLEPILAKISQAIDLIVKQLKQGGRLIYMGAGTSGRLGVLDAVECPPTFSSPADQIIGLIAGGNTAMFKAVEGAEDSEQMGKDDLANLCLTTQDIVVGIAASGRTPYVIGGIAYANEIGAPTITVTCNPTATLNQLSTVAIAANVGPEVLTGSTRLKAGTAQKLILNRLSTGALIQLGKCYENLMVDVNVSNNKLALRAIRIIEQALQCDNQHAKQLLVASDNNVKLAILMGRLNLNKPQAEKKLARANGFLRVAIQSDN